MLKGHMVRRACSLPGRALSVSRAWACSLGGPTVSPRAPWAVVRPAGEDGNSGSRSGVCCMELVQWGWECYELIPHPDPAPGAACWLRGLNKRQRPDQRGLGLQRHRDLAPRHSQDGNTGFPQPSLTPASTSTLFCSLTLMLGGMSLPGFGGAGAVALRAGEQMQSAARDSLARGCAGQREDRRRPPWEL